jgi:hypothetical protein
MNGFWHALARINARYLSLAAAVLLSLALLAWLLSLIPSRPRPNEGLLTPPTASSAGGASFDLLSRPATNGPSPNPFQSDHLSELVALSEEGLLRWNTPEGTPPPAQPEPEPPPKEEAKPPPAPRTVKLMYRGMITRTDGTTVAMIEREGQNRPTTHRAGSALMDGVSVTEIARNQMQVRVGEKTVVLRRGVQEVLEY